MLEMQILRCVIQMFHFSDKILDKNNLRGKMYFSPMLTHNLSSHDVKRVIEWNSQLTSE